MTTEHGRVGRPRSEQARVAVLRAVDDLLLEVGYAAMTMKGIAASAGVSRQTVYRWWSTKAEILLEATAADAEEELALDPAGLASGDPVDVVESYLESLARFLRDSPAGAAYRALLGEAQHDPSVARLLASTDVLGASARAVVERACPHLASPVEVEPATARLIGPTFFSVMAQGPHARLDPRTLAESFVRETSPAVTGRTEP